MDEKIFKDEYQRLNSEQKLAVETIEGPVMVLAGPGTGKTQVMAMRIANILKKTQANPYNILCLTFTNSAVKAMRERLIKIIGQDAYKIAIHTFHSFCNEIIQMHPERFLFAKTIVQISELEKMEYLSLIIDQNNWQILKPLKSPYYYQKPILKAIKDLKREGILPEEYMSMVEREREDFDKHPEYYHQKGKYQGKLMDKYKKLKDSIAKNHELAQIYKKYQELLDQNGKYDFDDMIMFVLRQFKVDPDFLADFQEKYLYLLVDEYQDTNGAQNKLIELLGSFDHDPNIFVVGDDDQSIYRFQGASLENMLIFKEIFPKTKTIVLKTNYRSTREIVKASRGLISRNPNQLADLMRIEKKVEAYKDKIGEKIVLAEFENEIDELYFIIEKIKELQAQGEGLDNIAIFYRNNHEVLELAEVLTRNGIGYHLEKGQNIFEDSLISRVIDVFTLINDMANAELWFRVLHFDWWQIESLSLYKIFNRFHSYQKSDNDFVIWFGEYQKNNIVDEKISKTINFLLDKRKEADNTTIATWVEGIFRDSGLNDYILNLSDRLLVVHRVKKFFTFIKSLNQADRSLTLSKLIMKLNKIIEDQVDIKVNMVDYEGEGVNLMTAHKSKGMEFDYIFIYRCMDEVWGNQKKREILPLLPGILKTEAKSEGEAEDRRLFYVALTRTRRRLWISWAKKYADEEKERSKSMFISELDPALVEVFDANLLAKNKEDFILALLGTKAELIFSRDEKDYLKKLLLDFKLSPTALNKYLECPRKFLYDNLIKVPKTKTPSLSFGTAIHAALENFYLVYKKTGHLPVVDDLIYYFKISLNQQIMTEADFIGWLKRGEMVLRRYYDQYHDDFKIPIFCEYNFALIKLNMDEPIPLTGKVDRVDLLEEKKVAVIDYKTGKVPSRNEILGQTKNSDGRYWRQLVFYKLLGQLAGNFKYEIVETELDFVGDSENSRPKKEKFSITSSDVEELKKIIKEVWNKINNLEFGCTSDQSRCKGSFAGKKCEYYNLCHNKA